MDQLVGLSDDLGKLDTFVEGVTRKVALYLGEVSTLSQCAIFFISVVFVVLSCNLQFHYR